MILEGAHGWICEIDGGTNANVPTDGHKREVNKSKNEYIYKKPVLKLVV